MKVGDVMSSVAVGMFDSTQGQYKAYEQAVVWPGNTTEVPADYASGAFIAPSFATVHIILCAWLKLAPFVVLPVSPYFSLCSLWKRHKSFQPNWSQIARDILE